MDALTCPQCQAVYIVNNGHAHTGKQRYLCRGCGHQFTQQTHWHRSSVATQALVDR